jgi:hypothetical protein
MAAGYGDESRLGTLPNVGRFEPTNKEIIMSETTVDALARYSQFNDHLSELRAVSNTVASDAELIEAAKNGGLVARQPLKMEDGSLLDIGDSVLIPAEHAFCNPQMVTTKQRQAKAAEYAAARYHLTLINPLANNVQQARRAVGDIESLVSTLSVQIKSVEAALDQKREWQKTAEADLIAALNDFYKSQPGIPSRCTSPNDPGTSLPQTRF